MPRINRPSIAALISQCGMTRETAREIASLIDEGYRSPCNGLGYYCDSSEHYYRDGWTRDGYNESGYDRNGHDRGGYNMLGYNAEGYDRYGHDVHGFDAQGYDY